MLDTLHTGPFGAYIIVHLKGSGYRALVSPLFAGNDPPALLSPVTVNSPSLPPLIIWGIDLREEGISDLREEGISDLRGRELVI